MLESERDEAEGVSSSTTPLSWRALKAAGVPIGCQPDAIGHAEDRETLQHAVSV